MAWSLVLVFALIVGVFILIFNTVRRSIAEPILDALKITQRVAGGDWSQQIRADARGEAGSAAAGDPRYREKHPGRNRQGGKDGGAGLAGGRRVARTQHAGRQRPDGGQHPERRLAHFPRQDAGGIKRSVLDEFLHSVEVGADLAMRNLQRAAELMSSFKQVAADRASSHAASCRTRWCMKPR
jgi:hypothetical protein